MIGGEGYWEKEEFGKGSGEICRLGEGGYERYGCGSVS